MVSQGCSFALSEGSDGDIAAAQGHKVCYLLQLGCEALGCPQK